MGNGRQFLAIRFHSKWDIPWRKRRFLLVDCRRWCWLKSDYPSDLRFSAAAFACLLHISFFVQVSLCEYNFMCWKIYIGMGRKRATRGERKNLYLLYIILQSKVERDPEKKNSLLHFSVLWLHLKSHFRFRFVVLLRREIYCDSS